MISYGEDCSLFFCPYFCSGRQKIERQNCVVFKDINFEMAQPGSKSLFCYQVDISSWFDYFLFLNLSFLNCYYNHLVNSNKN